MTHRRTHPLRALSLASLVAAAACSSGGDPTGPSSSGGTSSLAGQVVDQFSGAAIAGVTVQLGGASAVTDAQGWFSITEASRGAETVAVTGAAIHSRQTFASGSGVRIEVVPSSFDMSTFHDVGREHSQRTVRWLTSPVLYVDTRVTGGVVDPAELQLWISEIQALAPSFVVEWTDGTLAGQPVVVGQSPPTTGAIVVRFDENPASYPRPTTVGLASVSWNADGVVRAARIQLKLSRVTGPAAALARRAILAHELGHALGLGHMEGETASLMSPIVRTTSLTTFDRAVAQILYSRPPGNTNLDRDDRAMPASALSLAAGSISGDWGCRLSLDS